MTTRRAETLRLEHEITVWAEQELDRQRRSIVALERLVGALAAVEGRKAVVLATAGIQGFPARGLFAALDQQRQGPVKLTSTDTNRAPTLEVRGQELLLAFEQMVQAAQNARVAFYTVSPGARAAARQQRRVRGHRGHRLRGCCRATRESSKPLRASRASRERPGGASFTVGTDLDGRLAAVTADGDAAYSLGFTTSAAAGEKDHKIEVRALRARPRGAPPRELPAALGAAAGGSGARRRRDLRPGRESARDRLAARPRQDRGQEAVGPDPFRSRSAFRCASSRSSRRAQLRRGSVSVRVAIQDARGRMLESSAAIVPIVVPEDQMAKAMDELLVPPRRDAPRAGAHSGSRSSLLDEVSGLQSTTFAEIEIPGKK